MPRRRTPRQDVVIEPHTDDLPKRGLFTEPVRVTRLEALEPERLSDASHRVSFLVEVKDAEDQRCSELAVEATVVGPVRSATVQGNTDLLGRVRFRMTGPPGTYGISVGDVAAGGLDWDAAAGPTKASTDVPG